MFIRQNIYNQLVKSSKSYPIILIVGPKGTGKTTLLKHFQTKHPNTEYLSLKNPSLELQAKENPTSLLKSNPTPLIIDDIQYAPELIISIEKLTKKNNKPGMYFLAANQDILSLPIIAQNLHNQIYILEINSFSQCEILKQKSQKPFLPSSYMVLKHNRKGRQPKNTFDKIYKGGMPARFGNSPSHRKTFYEDYLRSFIEIDIKNAISIKDTMKFFNFMKCLALKTAKEINLNEIANSVKISYTAAKDWLAILESTKIVYLVKAFYINSNKGAIKRPKLYFLDTGLCSYLAQVKNAKELEHSNFSDQIFETFVASEIIKSYTNFGVDTTNLFFHFRNKNNRKIDLILKINNSLYPIKMINSTNFSKTDTKDFEYLTAIGESVGFCAIIGTNNVAYRISNNCIAIPYTVI